MGLSKEIEEKAEKWLENWKRKLKPKKRTHN